MENLYQKYTLLKYNEIKFTRFDKKLILDFTDPKKWDVFIVHANFHWSKDFEFKYIYTCIGSLSRMIVHHVKIFASLDKNSHKFSHDMQDQRLFVPNFLSPKLLNPHELSSLGGKKIKAIRTCAHRNFPTSGIPNMFANFPIFSQPFP